MGFWENQTEKGIRNWIPNEGRLPVSGIAVVSPRTLVETDKAKTLAERECQAEGATCVAWSFCFASSYLRSCLPKNYGKSQVRPKIQDGTPLCFRSLSSAVGPAQSHSPASSGWTLSDESLVNI